MVEVVTVTERTLAAVLPEIDQPLSLTMLEIPELLAGQVLVEMAYTGLCRSQLLEMHGQRGDDRYLPHTLGHEGSGVVSRVGPGVTKVRPGDHVVVSWIKGGGADVPFTAYQGPLGKVNSGAVSTFLEKAVVSENRLTVIDDEMPLREAALLGCAIPTGAGIVMHSPEIRPGAEVAVFGIGGIGLSALLAAGFKQAVVTAVDVIDWRLRQARELGAARTVNAATEDPRQAIRRMTLGRGVDVSIEASGRPEAMEQAFESVRDGGGLCVIAGNPSLGQRLSLDPFDLISGKRIVGTWGGSTDPDVDIPAYVRLFLSRELDISRLITHVYALAEINQAFEDLEGGRVLRALVRLRDI